MWIRGWVEPQNRCLIREGRKQFPHRPLEKGVSPGRLELHERFEHEPAQMQPGVWNR